MATSQSWIEQMQQVRKQQAQGGEEEPESKVQKETESPGAILHWLMKAAMPEWTPKELKSSKAKLKKVGVECCSDLEDALEEKGELNQRIRDANMKTFGPATLSRFRSQIKTHREGQRMQFLLEERRRLDLERKANPELPPSSTQSTADGQEETESLSTEDHLGINLDDCTTGSGSGSNTPGIGSPGAPVNTNAEEDHRSRGVEEAGVEEAALNTEDIVEEDSAVGEDEAEEEEGEEEEGGEEEEAETSPALSATETSPAEEEAETSPALSATEEESEIPPAETSPAETCPEVVNAKAETAEPVSQHGEREETNEANEEETSEEANETIEANERDETSEETNEEEF